MRLAKPLELDRISQVLAKGACPICAFLKNDQASLLRGELRPEAVTDICNFHAWALAAAVDSDHVARVFSNVLKRKAARPSDEGQCSFCARLLQFEVSHIRELIEHLSAGGLVVDWIKRQGMFCLTHGAHLRELAPPKLHQLIDEVMQQSIRKSQADLKDVLNRTETEKGAGGGVLGRTAEFLVAQRGLR